MKTTTPKEFHTQPPPEQNPEQTMEKAAKLHYNELIAYALSLTNNKTQAKDLVQETYAALAKNLHNESYQDQGLLRAYLYKTLFNIFTTEKRRGKKLPEVIKKFIRKHDLNDHDQLMPFTLTKQLEQAIKILADEDAATEKRKKKRNWAKIITMNLIEGFTHKEIAEKLNIPEGTVASSLYKGKKRLKEIVLINNPDIEEDIQ